MSIVAIITARGGSKRIPRKNIKDFMGKPMLAYAINAALESKIFDEVMVSTEDIEIAEIAQKLGAKVPFMRSLELADDFSGTVDVLLDVLKMYKNQNKSFDEICCIYPCVPFLTGEILKKAYAKFHGSQALIPLCKYSTPVERAWEVKEGKMNIWNEVAFKKRSQDLEPKYFDVGMFYFAQYKAFIEAKSFVTLNPTPFIMNEYEVQDIDTQEDWEMAEMKYRLLMLAQ